jgi:hypothetical protein
MDRNEDDVERDDFTRNAEGRQPGFFTEMWWYLRANRKWWLTPVIVIVVVLGLLVVIGGSGAAPFIYTLF